MLCFSHMTKNLKDDIDKAFQDSEERRVVSGVVGHIFSLSTSDEIKDFLKLVMVLLGSPKKTKNFVRIKFIFKTMP